MSDPLKTAANSRPILVPLGAGGLAARLRAWRHALPAAAAPLAVTLAGGLAIAVVVAGLADRDEAASPVAASDATPAAATTGETDLAERDPAASAPAVSRIPVPTVENAAILTAPLGGTGSVPALGPASGDDLAGGFVAPEPDAAWTSAIPPARPGGDLVPVVEIAETVAEVEALEAAQQREVEADLATPSPESGNVVPFEDAPSPEATAAIPPSTGPRVPATTTKWVNLRAGPSDDAEVLLVVPALETVQAEAGCDWCAVTYDGREGFIYKTLLSYGDGGE